MRELLKSVGHFWNKRYRAQTMLCFSFMLLNSNLVIAKKDSSINCKGGICKYCETLSDAIKDDNSFAQCVVKAVQIFINIKNDWVRLKGNQYRYAIKDNLLFTEYMFMYMRGGNTEKISERATKKDTYRGTVTTVKKDRNDMFYGFIKKYPTDVFIHEDDCPNIDFNNLVGKDVVYSIISNDRKFNTSKGKIEYVVEK